jgi:hypothetical protein
MTPNELVRLFYEVKTQDVIRTAVVLQRAST